MPQDTRTGLFGLGVLPGQTRSEFGGQKTRAQMLEIAEREEMRGRGRDPRFTSARTRFGQAGAALANVLSNSKFGQEKLGLRPGNLNEQESRMFDIQEAGQAAYQSHLDSLPEGQAAELSAGDKRTMLMDNMAREAAAAGDMGTYAKLLEAMHMESQQARLNEAKIAQLEGQAPGGSQWNFDRMRKFWPASRRAEVQQTYAATRSQIQHTSDMLALAEEVREGGQHEDILTRDPGEIITFLDRIKNVAQTGLHELERITGGDNSPMNQVKGRFNPRSLAENNETWSNRTSGEDDSITNGSVAERLEEFIPDNIDGAVERARYKSIVIQMAYAAWRQNEGSGSRQASNQDIMMALDTIGANGTSFNSIVQTMLQNSMAGVRKFRGEMVQHQTSGMAIGLDPEFVESALAGGSIDDLDVQMGELLNRAEPFMAPLEERAELPDENRWAQQDDGSFSYGNATIVFED